VTGFQTCAIPIFGTELNLDTVEFGKVFGHFVLKS
jgi:hypothetical protein